VRFVEDDITVKASVIHTAVLNEIQKHGLGNPYIQTKFGSQVKKLCINYLYGNESERYALFNSWSDALRQADSMTYSVIESVRVDSHSQPLYRYYRSFIAPSASRKLIGEREDEKSDVLIRKVVCADAILRLVVGNFSP